MRAVTWMAMLNKVSCETMLEFDAHSCTDITGFGLSGHALGMAKGSNVRMRMRFEDIPKYDESLELIGKGVATSVTASNLQVAQDYLTFSGRFSGRREVAHRRPADVRRTAHLPAGRAGPAARHPPARAREHGRRRDRGRRPGRRPPGLEFLK